MADNVAYSYTAHVDGLEEENKLLRDSLDNQEREIENLRKQLERYQKPPLVACEVKTKIDNHILVKLPNGNEFLVENTSKENLLAGDTVLAEQKNLTIIRKINKTNKFDAEKFVIIEKPSTAWETIGGLKEQERHCSPKR